MYLESWLYAYIHGEKYMLVLQLLGTPLSFQQN